MIKSASMTGEKDYEGTCSGRLASSRNDAPGAVSGVWREI